MQDNAAAGSATMLLLTGHPALALRIQTLEGEPCNVRFDVMFIDVLICS